MMYNLSFLGGEELCFLSREFNDNRHMNLCPLKLLHKGAQSQNNLKGLLDCDFN